MTGQVHTQASPKRSVGEQTPLLEVRNVSKSFSGVEVLHDVSFAVKPGSVHALMGENGAGKSTLTKILIGWHSKDSGDILVKGNAAHFTEPGQALKAGISIIQQELSPIRDMSVAENIFLGREPKLGPFVHYARLNAMAEAVLEQLGLELAPERKLGTLSLAEIQLVEIARALSHNAEIVIMDEPTSALGDREIGRLLELINQLKAQGKGIIYISHKLEEIFAVADDITVLRDGKLVGSAPAGTLDREKVIQMMVGKELESFSRQGHTAKKELLSVQNFSRTGEFEDVSLTLHEGEILGIFGLMGAGKSEFLHTLFGVTQATSGQAVFGGVDLLPNSPTRSRNRGLALVTEDRKKSGLLPVMSVKDNIGVATLGKLSAYGVVREGKVKAQVETLARTLDVRSASLEQPIKNLSGGNQQKAILARWLLTDPQVLLLDEPTRGIDVGAKREIYQFMSEFARGGKGIIMVSSELPEVLGMSDRIAVLRRGRLVDILPRERCTKETLMNLAI